MIYFQLIESAQGSVGAGVQYTSNLMFVAKLDINDDVTLPQTNAPSVFGYMDTSSSSSQVSGRNFAISNFIIKIPPSSSYGYNIEASI